MHYYWLGEPDAGLYLTILFSKIDTDISGADLASAKIYEGIKSGKPFMVARYGSTELATVVNYLGVKRKKKESGLIYIS